MPDTAIKRELNRRDFVAALIASAIAAGVPLPVRAEPKKALVRQTFGYVVTIKTDGAPPDWRLAFGYPDPKLSGVWTEAGEGTAP